MWFIVLGTSVSSGRYHEADTNPCGPSKISSAGTRASMSAHCGSARAKCPETTSSSSAESSSRQNPYVARSPSEPTVTTRAHPCSAMTRRASARSIAYFDWTSTRQA